MVTVTMQKIVFLCLVVFAKIYAQLEIGDKCGPSKSKTCVLVDNCPEAIESIKKNRQHDLERCGWQGIKEIVCCAKRTSIVDSKNPLRKSVAACVEYWKLLNSSHVDSSAPFIINGVNATKGEFPHMAALGYEKPSGNNEVAWGDCGGVLISKDFVLTAAHCMVRADERKPIMVRLGKVDLFGDADDLPAQDIPVAQNIPYKEYKHLEKLHDIALVRLARSAQFSKYVMPICIYTKSDVPVGLVISGWGKTKSDGEPSRFLLKAYVEPADLDACNKTYLESSAKKPIYDTQLCAFSPKEFPSDTCQGDSGGPIHVVNRKDTQETGLIVIGITSFGKGCGGPVPSVYTRVSSYLDWIEEHVWP